MSFRKYLNLLAVGILPAVGDVFLSRGMKEVGAITLADWHRIAPALLDPWVMSGIVLLIGFFASYLTALSWADLTYVLPASAFGYILTAFLARVMLHEHVSPLRWLGIALIVAGVGFVAGGEHRTERSPQSKETIPEIADTETVA